MNICDIYLKKSGMVIACLLYLLVHQHAVAQGSSQPNGSDNVSESVDNSHLSNYKLMPGDRVNIGVFGESELTVAVQLSQGGTFNYPFLGSMNVLGKTVSDVQFMIEEGLKDGYLLDPKVSVTMDSYREIYVSGEVVRGGNFPFQSGLSVSKAIVLAGGFTERAAKNRIKVVSEGASGSKGTIVDLDYIVKPGDVITVSRRFF